MNAGFDTETLDGIPNVKGEIHYPKTNTATASELTVTVKDDEKTLKAKYLLYEGYLASFDDVIVKSCVAETLKSFEGEPTDIRVRINLSM